MAILTKSGRTALASSIAEQSIFMGWGRGESAWEESPPEESTNSEQLIDAIGYRQATNVAYCQPDLDGDIELSTGRFSLSEVPTNHLYLTFNFDFDDGAEQIIKEVAIMVGTLPKSDLPAGQKYFTPTELDSPGTLLLLEHRSPLSREQGVRESFEFVVTF